MVQKLQVPGVGIVEFPDEMSKEAMNEAIQQNFPNLSAYEGKSSNTLPEVTAYSEEQSEPLDLGEIKGVSTTDIYPRQKALLPALNQGESSVANRFKAGLADSVYGGAQLFSHAFPNVTNSLNNGAKTLSNIPGIGSLINSLGLPMEKLTPEIVDYVIQERERKMQNARQADGQEGFDGARLAGNVVPFLAQGLAGSPLKALALALKTPGIATNLASRIIGSGTASAAGSALAPVTEKDESFPDQKARQIMLSAALGGALPIAGQAVAATGAALQPFYKGGQDAIVGGVFNKVAGSKHDALKARSNLLNATELVPGSAPTTGQAAGNAGIAALERTASATDPVAMMQRHAILKKQDEARINALNFLMPNKKTAISDRERAVSDLYSAADKEVLTITPELKALFERPSVKSAIKKAKNLAKENGENFDIGEITGRNAHYIKMALDDMANASSISGIGKNELRAVTNTLDNYLSEIESQIPVYKQARNTYSELSAPINQADVIDSILQKSQNFKGEITPSAYAKALSDSTAKSVTGRDNASLSKVMSKEQREILNAIKEDLLRKHFSDNAGRGVGSDTVQKLAYSNMIDKSGIPSAVFNNPLGGIAGRISDSLYKRANEELRQKLAQALDPKEAARLMERANDSANTNLFLQTLEKPFQVGASTLFYPSYRSQDERP